jgi:hypothetical protein
VKLKPVERAYGIEAVFLDHVPKLEHGNDGLIFTSAEAPYTPGTDPKMSIALPCTARQMTDEGPQIEMETAVGEFNRLSARAPLPSPS